METTKYFAGYQLKETHEATLRGGPILIMGQEGKTLSSKGSLGINLPTYFFVSSLDLEYV
jgi:hypothetical protein